MVLPLCDPVTRGLTQKFEVEEIVGAGCTVGRLDSIKTKLKKPVLWSVVAAPRLNKSPSYFTWPPPANSFTSSFLFLSRSGSVTPRAVCFTYSLGDSLDFFSTGARYSSL